MKTTLILALTVLSSLPMLAGEKVKLEKLAVKTLPVEAYSALQPGKKLTHVFKTSGFIPSNGFKVGTVDYKAENRVGEAFDYLKNQLATMEKSNSIYTLNLTVVDADPGKMGVAFGNNWGFILVEGVVLEGSNPVAYFVTKEKGDWGGIGVISQKPSVDKILSAISAELLK